MAGMEPSEVPPASSDFHALPVGYSNVGYFPPTTSPMPPPGAHAGMPPPSAPPAAAPGASDAGGGVAIEMASPYFAGGATAGMGAAAPAGQSWKPPDAALAPPAGAPVADGRVAEGAAPTEYQTGLTSYHLCLGFTNLLAILMILLFFGLERQPMCSWCNQSTDLMDWPGPMLLPFMIIAVLGYYIHACGCTETARFLRNRQDLRAALDYIQTMKVARPRIMMHVESFHHETRSSGSGKNRKTRRVKVVTASASEPFEYSNVDDLSGELRGLDQYTLTMVKYSKARTWADPFTEWAFNAQFGALQAMYRGRDREFRAWETVELQGFHGEVLVSGTAADDEGCVRRDMQLLASALLLAWPFALYVEWKSARTKFSFVKRIQVSPHASQDRLTAILGAHAMGSPMDGTAAAAALAAQGAMQVPATTTMPVAAPTVPTAGVFCTQCGTQDDGSSAYCLRCGHAMH
uniref:Uncharacterized protein n=1 Tax=Bicosoecida sp. CB-2014 TaxID=1486930 RepID=A0A7S1CBG8_9STRA